MRNCINMIQPSPFEQKDYGINHYELGKSTLTKFSQQLYNVHGGV